MRPFCLALYAFAAVTAHLPGRPRLSTGRPPLRLRAVVMTDQAAGENATQLSSELRRELQKRPRLWGLKHKGDKGDGDRPVSDGRDLLPYTLTSIGPPEKMLGTFKLDPLTHNGDQLFVNDKRYVVKRVTFCYKLNGGRYQMVRKAAACKEKERIAAEVALQRMFEADSVQGVEDLDNEL